MNLVFWPGAVLMVLNATITSTFVAANGRSAWFVGVALLAVYMILVVTLFLVPPRGV